MYEILLSNTSMLAKATTMKQLLQKASSGKLILVFALLFCVLSFYAFPSYTAKLKKIAGGEVKILDTRYSYSNADVQTLFEKLGSEGRELYRVYLRTP